MRNGIPCPWELIIAQLAERFGQWPGAVERRPAREVLWWVNVLGAESSARSDLDGLSDEDEMIRERWEG